MESDIVARLRAVLHNDRSVELMNREAADEIERMRDERDEARRERDEARRELCMDEALIRLERGRVPWDSEEVVRIATEVSVERGWDCFPEATR